MIIFLFIWNLIISFVAITALLGAYNNYKEIEAIRSWYPFLEILKMKIGREDSES